MKIKEFSGMILVGKAGGIKMRILLVEDEVEFMMRSFWIGCFREKKAWRF